MKKLIALLLAVMMCCALCACAAQGNEDDKKNEGGSLMDQLLAEQEAARAKIYAQAYGTWKIAEAKDGAPNEVVIKEDGTCTIDGKAMFWSVYKRTDMYPSEGAQGTFSISVTEKVATTQFAKEENLVYNIKLTYSDVNVDLTFTVDGNTYTK